MNVLIAGCGVVGNLLGIELTQLDHKTWGIRRDVSAIEGSIKPISLDLTAKIDPRLLPPDIDVVFYLPTPSERNKLGYRRIFVDGLRNLFDALDASTIRRLIYVSSTSVYGIDEGSMVDEETNADPTSETAQQLLAGELLANACAQETIIVRFGGIYGGHRSRLIDRVMRGTHAVARRKYTNRIHQCDCARVLTHMATLEKPATHYVAVDGKPTLEVEVMDFIAKALDVPPLPRLAVEPPEHRGKRCRNDRLLASGYEFCYEDYQAGYQPMIETYLKHYRE